MLNCLNQWCKKWQLMLNMEKTKVVHYRHSSCQRSEYTFKFGNETVEYKDKYKYLGLWLQEHLDFKVTVSQLAASGNRALGGLISKFHGLGEIDYDAFYYLYSSLVIPVLNYGAGIWGTCHYQCLNSVQNKACRFFLGVGPSTANCATRGDMGWPPQYHRQYVEVFRLWGRIQNLPDDRQCKCIHDFCLSKGEKSLWEVKVKQLLGKIDRNLVLEEQIVNKQWLKAFENKLTELDQIAWHSNLFNDKNCINGNKLRIYRNHKSRMECETYVKNKHISRYGRSVMSKLRSGSLPLMVETGRYNNIPLGDRICTLCSHNKIEDEIHFVVECEFYNDIRYDLFDHMVQSHADFMDLPSLAKYCILMTENASQVILSRAICKMFNRRKNHI